MSETTARTTRAERMAMPQARDSIRKIAESVGGCLRPIQLRRTDTVTGEHEAVMIPCGATLASICPPCAERARKLRAEQCRDGWHLEDEPDFTPAAPDEMQAGAVRYRARVKSHGRYVATRVFERRADAVAWEQDQRRRLRVGEWIDPRRGQVPLSLVAADWLGSRSSVKRRTRESDEAAWRNYIGPRFGNWPVASITAAEVSGWVGSLVARGLAPSTATRALATLRSVLAFAAADGRVQHNVAAAVRKPTSGRVRREGRALTLDELRALTEACKGCYRDVVPVLALAGLRWGELAGLQVGDRVSVPGPGLRLRRAVLASGGGGALYVDTLKNNRARTVPLVLDLVPIVDRWSAGKAPDAWLFNAPEGGPLRESNWKRSVGWTAATSAAGVPGFRVHDLRHTAASVWLGAGADPKVVQRVLGHATAAMTMDLYGHMVDANLWQAARLVGDTSGTSEPSKEAIRTQNEPSQDTKNA